MTTLKEVREFLNSIPHINNGGCLISAYVIYLWLKKNNQLTDEFRILEFSANAVTKFANSVQYLKEDESYALGCDHAVVYMNNEIIDTSKEKNMTECPDILLYSVVVDPKDHENALLSQINSASWNNKFNRAMYVPAIADKLGLDLSSIKLNFGLDDSEKRTSLEQSIVEKLHEQF